LAAPVERFAVARFAAGFAAEVRAEAAPVDLARVAVDFFAPAGLARVLLAAGFLRVAEALRVPVELRDDEVEPEEDDPDPPLPRLVALSDHLPDITRCAASATASAISEPNLVALATMLLAACDAVSAASRPASRIALRALGLLLIAAAAAARPAASISLLIAALASLSILLVSFEFEEDLDELVRADLAIASSPLSRTKTLQDRNGSRTNPHALFRHGRRGEVSAYVKGHRCTAAMPFDMVSGRR
jgi:hypothetical protein